MAVDSEESELLYAAWVVIANVGVHRGGWREQCPEWIEAAGRWRDDWHKWLKERCDKYSA